jgi:predicted Zn-dependent protease
MMLMLLRTALVFVAVLALGWLGVLYRDARLGQSAAGVFYPGTKLSQSEFDRQMERLRDAQLLNPSRTWETLRVSFLLLAERPQEALRVADRLVAEEPDNVEAWLVLRGAAERVDPRREKQAIAEIRRLNPLSGPSR